MEQIEGNAEGVAVRCQMGDRLCFKNVTSAIRTARHGVPFMPQALKATYRNGAFILHTSCDLPEGAEVELLIQLSHVVSPPLSDPATKQRFLKELIERMQQNPIPLNAPHLTREMLYERR